MWGAQVRVQVLGARVWGEQVRVQVLGARVWGECMGHRSGAGACTMHWPGAVHLTIVF